MLPYWVPHEVKVDRLTLLYWDDSTIRLMMGKVFVKLGEYMLNVVADAKYKVSCSPWY